MRKFPFALILLVLSLHAQVVRKPIPGPISEIRLEISSPTETFRIGDDIKIGIRLVNDSSSPVFVGKNVYGHPAQIFSVEIEVKDEEGNTSLKGAGAADGYATKAESFARALARDWVLLFPSEYWGGYRVINEHEFPALGKPGQYLIKAKYRSRGLAAEHSLNRLLLDRKEIEKLTYPAWVGEITSNEIFIHVMPR
jgi:hypothetical protein